MLFDEIRGYYEEVARETGARGESVPSLVQKSLVRKRNELEPYFSVPERELAEYREVSIPSVWRRVGSFGRRHPVTGSSILIAMLALAGLIVNSILPGHEYPSYYYDNISTNRLDIYSASNKLLWSLSAFNIKNDYLYDQEFLSHSTVIADLDGDGKVEVVTTIPLRQDGPKRTLRAYDGEGHLLREMPVYDKPVRFKGASYYDDFVPIFLTSEAFPNGKRDLLVSYNNGRSPSFLARTDGHLNVIGRYWHFGNFFPLVFRGPADGDERVAIVGTNDYNELSGGKFDFLAILDPSKIVGDKESPETPGFSLNLSDAEVYYIRLPRSSIEWAEQQRFFPTIRPGRNDSLLSVQVLSGSDDQVPGFWGFQYVFETNGMRVVDVKYNSGTVRTFEELRSKGLVHGAFDQKYLDALKEGVRYWNGKEWVKTPTKINHAYERQNGLAAATSN